MRLKKTLLIAALLALIAAAWLLPPRWQWESQRDRVAALAESRLGRPVRIAGRLSLNLLPEPVIDASAVQLGAEGPDDIAVRAARLRLRLSLAALLRGRLELRDLALSGAELTIPWPPGSIAALRPPPWRGGFEARLEGSVVRIGAAVFEHVTAHIAAPDPFATVRLSGRFLWRGIPAQFTAFLGRPGWDGAATFDLTLHSRGAEANARGILAAEGGFSGRLEVRGGDLTALLAAPLGPFRTSGRLLVGPDFAAFDAALLELGGSTGRAALTLRFVPEARLELALALLRVDLEPWVTAFNHPAPLAFPLTLDLSAEAASWRGLTLRRLRSSVTRGQEGLTLGTVAAELPGQATLELHGASRDGRTELALHWATPDLRATLAALDFPLSGSDPARLRAFSGRARLALAQREVVVEEVAATLDGARIGGAGVFRQGPRPALGLGLTFERLDLDAVLPTPLPWEPWLNGDPGFDANLRLNAETVQWRGLVAERLSLDAAIEGPRITLRRLGAHFGGADLSLTGSLQTAPSWRFGDSGGELTARSGRQLVTAVAPFLPFSLPAGLTDQPLRLQLRGAGAAERMALAAEAELGELRLGLEGEGDIRETRFRGRLVMRHPGTPRLLMLLGAQEPPAWLGEGSFSLVTTLTLSRESVVAEAFELVAGRLRGGGRLGVTELGGQPRLSGRIVAETLPLPGLPAAHSDPFLGMIGDRFAGEITLQAAEARPLGGPLLRDLSALLRWHRGQFSVERFRAGVSGGSVEGAFALDLAAALPRLVGSFGIAGVALTGPLFATPLDLASGRLDAEGRFVATGHAPAAWRASLRGEGRFAFRDGVLRGLDLAAAMTAAANEEPAAAEAGLRAAMAGGATAIERLSGGWRAENGLLLVTEGRLVAESGLTAGLEGRVDLAREGVDVRFLLPAATQGAPPIGLRFSGPARVPRPQPELAEWLLWRTEQEAMARALPR